MKVFQVNYFTNGYESVSFAVAESEGQAWEMVRGGHNFELISIKECDLSKINIIHTEVYEAI
jgi:hypothetical protein